MLDARIALNEDLRQLRAEGYELELRDGFAAVHHVPYLNEACELGYGSLISALDMSGNRTLKPSDHQLYFTGDFPCDKEGKRMLFLRDERVDLMVGGYPCKCHFSNKPEGGYTDYYQKFTTYCKIIAEPAKRLFPDATAITFKTLGSVPKSVFWYDDTNSSRAGIENTSRKLCGQKIGVVGLGGTGSYLLDQVAKTPVAEIHLFDGDCFYNHNAFRAPGAPAIDDFRDHEFKTSRFAEIYGHMHKHIISHPYFLDEDNMGELQKMDFVFLCIDSGIFKKQIVDALMDAQIPFIDTGISVTNNEETLNGMVRVDYWDKSEDSPALQYLDFSEDKRDDPYNSNVQIADLNALAAVLAVIRWKKCFGYYADVTKKVHEVYTMSDEKLFHEKE